MLTWKPDFENAENVGVIRLILYYAPVEPSYFLGTCVDVQDLREAVDRRMYLGDLDDDLPSDLWMDGRVEVCTDLQAVEAFQTLTALGLGEFGPLRMQRIRERLAQYRTDRQWNKNPYTNE